MARFRAEIADQKTGTSSGPNSKRPAMHSSLTVVIDQSCMQVQLVEFVRLLSRLPKRRANKFFRKFLCLTQSTGFLQLGKNVAGTAGSASDIVFRPRIVGLDELVASAFRASDLYRALDVPGHKNPPVVDDVVVGTADSTTRGDAERWNG